jgi:hypothetical protein
MGFTRHRLHLLDVGQTHGNDHAFYLFLQKQQLAHLYIPIAYVRYTLTHRRIQHGARRIHQSPNDCNGCSCRSPCDCDGCDCRASQLGCSHPARSPLGDPKRNELCVRRLHQYEVAAKDHAQHGKEAANRAQFPARFQAGWRHQEPRQTIRPSPNIASSSLLLLLSCRRAQELAAFILTE